MLTASLRNTSPAHYRPVAGLLLSLKWLDRFGLLRIPEDHSNTLTAASVVRYVSAVLNNKLPEDTWTLGFET